MISLRKGIANLTTLYRLADAHDRSEGLLAYTRYRHVMSRFSSSYDMPLHRVTAAFVALSPNNDYIGNLRSLKSCIEGVRDGRPDDLVIVTTFGAAKSRALSYLRGDVDFWETAKGRKTRAFYQNILDPSNRDFATIDGHMIAGWLGEELTMSEAALKRIRYDEVERWVFALAKRTGLVPNQIQAIIWFARKRHFRIKFDGQLGLFADSSDVWGTLINVDDIAPFVTTVDKPPRIKGSADQYHLNYEYYQK